MSIPQQLSTWVFACALWIASGGCAKKPEPAAIREPARVEVSNEKPAATPPVASPKPRFSQRDVEALADRWLDAQNQGDFTDYERLYARRMLGIKRVGARSKAMTRSAWMADRERMFRKPMNVVVEDRSIHAQGANAVVEFTQRWTQGKFMDVGRKRLLLVQEGAVLRIAHEEMLTSEIASHTSRLSETMLPVLRVDARAHIVIRANAEPGWGIGPFTKPRADGIDVAYLQHAERDLPRDVAAWHNRAVTVYDPNGASCRTTVVELRLFAGALGSFLTDAEAEDFDDVQRIGPLAFRQQRPSLLGKLEGCDGSFALVSPLEPAAIYPSLPLAPELEQRALAAARALPFYTERQRAWTELLKADGTSEAEAQAEAWEEGANVALFGGALGKRFVTVSLSSSGCGGSAAGSMFELYELQSDASLRLVSEGSAEFLPTLLLDVDGDGQLELTSGDIDRALYAVRSGAITRLGRIPYFLGVCGC